MGRPEKIDSTLRRKLGLLQSEVFCSIYHDPTPIAGCSVQSAKVLAGRPAFTDLSASAIGVPGGSRHPEVTLGPLGEFETCPDWGGKPVWPGSALSEMHDLPEAILQRRHLFRCGDYAQPTMQAFLCHRSNLIAHRHCRAPITGDRDQDRRAGLRRTRQRDNDHRPSPFI
jgi:hypothetical protein